jgi:hypothetical protein
MPVLTTIVAVSYLFGGSKGDTDRASFLYPPLLRAKLEELPEGERRTRALALTNRLDELVKEYDDATDDAISAYISAVEKYTTTADELIDGFESLDRVHRKVYRELVEIRQALVDTLSAEEWEEVFGGYPARKRKVGTPTDVETDLDESFPKVDSEPE